MLKRIMLKRMSYLLLSFFVWIAIGACASVNLPPPQFIQKSELGAFEVNTAQEPTFEPNFLIVTGLRMDIEAVLAEVVRVRDEYGLEGSYIPPNSFENPEGQIVLSATEALAWTLTGLLDHKRADLSSHADFFSRGDFVIARLPLTPNVESNDYASLYTAIMHVRAASASLYKKENPEEAISFPVTAELNLGTSIAGGFATSDPNSVGAEPYGKPVATGASIDNFWNQWAFTSTHGIGLLNEQGELTSHPACAPTKSMYGRPQVYVFDTVPFTLTGTATNWVSVPITTNQCIPQFELSIDPPVVQASSNSTNSIQFHGLFAASLIYGVAPEADIHLVRVLRDDGYGYLHDLLKGMIDAYTNVTSQGDRTPTVFNLSLGLDDPKWPLDGESKQAIQEQVCGFYQLETCNDFPDPQLPLDSNVQPFGTVSATPRAALEAVISLATNAGIVIVAASGNDSDPGEQFPAVYKSVLGVGAYGPPAGESATVEPACYSNKSDVYAPAGDSGNGCNPEILTECEDGTCPYGVVGVTGWPGHWQTAFWSGTSFAAPLVSGMIARRSMDVELTPAISIDAYVDLVQDTKACQRNKLSHNGDFRCIAKVAELPGFSTSAPTPTP